MKYLAQVTCEVYREAVARDSEGDLIVNRIYLSVMEGHSAKKGSNCGSSRRGDPSNGMQA